MPFDNLLVDVRDGIARVALNRPVTLAEAQDAEAAPLR
jgi:hypothetical protein